MSSSTGLIANPGDEIKVDQTHSYVILGPGLLQDGPKRVVATRAGILHFKKPHTYWLESHVKKYWPARGMHYSLLYQSTFFQIASADLRAVYM